MARPLKSTSTGPKYLSDRLRDRLVFVLQIGDEHFRCQEKTRNAGGAFQGYSGDLGGVDDAGLDHVTEFTGPDVVAVVWTGRSVASWRDRKVPHRLRRPL